MANQIHPIGYPVSKETAEEVYTGLGEKNWWKQLYDGKYHRFGYAVFDEGLHVTGAAEPGYYESALKAFEFAKRHLNDKLSVEFYCNLHKEACAHFRGAENRTQIKACDAGRFRDVGDSAVKFEPKLYTMVIVYEREKIKKDDRRKGIILDYKILKKAYGANIVKICADDTTLKDRKRWSREFTITAADAQEIDILIQKKFDATKATLNEWANDPVIKNAIPKITLVDDVLRIIYRKPKYNFSFDVVIPHLFETFNRTLSEINEELINNSPNEQEKIDRLVDKKLVLISDLYGKLEWLHPFLDGQGRTDLLLLAKLLSENGFTPAILDDPYMSSFSSREDWVAYLKEGMQKWAEQRESHY